MKYFSIWLHKLIGPKTPVVSLSATAGIKELECPSLSGDSGRRGAGSALLLLCNLLKTVQSKRPSSASSSYSNASFSTERNTWQHSQSLQNPPCPLPAFLVPILLLVNTKNVYAQVLELPSWGFLTFQRFYLTSLKESHQHKGEPQFLRRAQNDTVPALTYLSLHVSDVLLVLVEVMPLSMRLCPVPL